MRFNGYSYKKILILSIVLLIGSFGNLYANLVNGDFSTNDFTGWNHSANSKVENGYASLPGEIVFNEYIEAFVPFPAFIEQTTRIEFGITKLKFDVRPDMDFYLIVRYENGPYLFCIDLLYYEYIWQTVEFAIPSTAWGRNVTIKFDSGQGLYAGVDNVTLIPEPTTLALFGLGGLLLRRKK